ncbi:MAG: ATP-binding protein [Candidatus Staskawiczbacteria bacterium]|nr:ATP-binding protein [Candidatus Staskawiczbacteria bacterium]
MNVDWIIFLSGVLNSLIGILVWRSNPKAKLNIYFGIFCLVVSVQIFFDFIFRFFPALFILRCSYAFAVLIPLAASLWIFEICNFHIKKWLYFLFFGSGLIFFVIAFMDGLIVKEIRGLSMLGYEGTLGPLFMIYTFYLASYIVFFAWLIYYNQRAAEKVSDFSRRTQLNYILCGMLLYSGFATVFSLIMPIFFNIYSFTLLDAPCFIFFVGFTGYAITKHHLFNVRIIATELLTFALWLVLMARTFWSVTFQDIIFNGVILFFVVFFGVLLIRSVIKEVEQKEKMEKMAEEIKRAYDVEKKANAELAELDNVKNQFLMTIQHHLRTPLTSMRGYSDLLLSGAFGKVPPKIREVIEKFEASTTSLIKMVNDFLDVTQFQLGKQVISLKDGVNLPPILEEVVGDIKLEAEAKGIHLKLEKPEGDCIIRADESKLKAALVNIFDNAVKYTEKGEVAMSLKVESQKVKIEIKDTGMGISKERLPKLFDNIFERTSESKKSFTMGRGIGLYLASQIIKAHNGKIWVESAGEGKGSTFYIELPRN